MEKERVFTLRCVSFANSLLFDIMAHNQFQERFKRLAEDYLAHLDAAQLEPLLSLFSAGGVVLSPLYGQLPATDFYTRLFADTNNSRLQLKDVLVNPAKASGCIYFNYAWDLANGEVVSFDVIDYLQLNEAGEITFLHIVYDTVQSRPAWQQT